MSKQVNMEYLIKLFTEKSYAVSRVNNGSSELGMTLSDMIQAISEASGVVYATASQRLKNTKSANTKKARLVLGVTEQVAEDQWERHMKTVDVDVPVSADKERLGSNLEALASPFKPNSPKQAHHEALASCVLDLNSKGADIIGGHWLKSEKGTESSK
jgi:hypothetical protein